MYYDSPRKRRERIQNTRNMWRHNRQKYSKIDGNRFQKLNKPQTELKKKNHSLNAETKEKRKQNQPEARHTIF